MTGAVIKLIALSLAFAMAAGRSDAMNEYESTISRGSDEPRFKLITIDIAGLHVLDGTGRYDKILNAAISSSGLPIEPQLVPPTRALRDFGLCKNCCLSPINLNPEFYDFSDAIESLPMHTAKIVIFTKPGTPVMSQLASLRSLRVGAPLGVPHGTTIEQSGIIDVRFATVHGNIQYLQRGRIDAFIAYIPDAYTAFADLGLEPFPHNAQQPLAVHNDSVVCRGQTGEKFIAVLNNHLSPD